MSKFNLEFPYSQDWDRGTVVINPEGRRNILLYNSENKKRSTVSYARYLMAVSLKRYLLPEEHVDHINGKKNQDVLENLQIVNVKQNNDKRFADTGKTRMMAKFECPGCGKDAVKPYNQTHVVKKGKYTTCSRRCSRKVQSMYSKDRDKLVEIGLSQKMELFRETPNLNISTSRVEYQIFECSSCRRVMQHSSALNLCQSCNQRREKPELRKSERPSKETLRSLISSKTPWTKIGKMYGVSDNAVRKWAKSYGLEMPPRKPRSGNASKQVLLVEKELGRSLKPGEVVHHLDGDKTNNCPENLIVLERDQHFKIMEWVNSGMPGVRC